MTSSERPNPFGIHLPDSLIIGQLSAAMGVLVKGVAWEIGERFDAVLSHRYGGDWISEHFAPAGGFVPELHDPDFVIDWFPAHSIVWDALPPYTVELGQKFRFARITRNRWEHEAAKQTPQTFITGVGQILKLAEPLGLKSRAYVPLLVARVHQLQLAGGVLPPDEIELELERQREIAQQAQRDAEDAIKRAEQAAREADINGVAAGVAQAELEVARHEAEVALKQIEELTRALDQAGRKNRLAVNEPAESLRPGDSWGQIPLGIRVLTLKARMVDLMDQATQTLLSQQIGQVAHEAALRWLTLMPQGGEVHLTTGGHAAGRVGGVYIYLGRLDQDRDSGNRPPVV